MQEINFAAVELYVLCVEPHPWIKDPDAARRNFNGMRKK